MAKIKCRTQVDSTGTETIVNDIRDWGVLIIVLYKLMKLFHLKNLLRELFTKAMHLFPYLWVPFCLWLVLNWFLDFPTYYLNAKAHASSVHEGIFFVHFWHAINIVSILFTPWGIAWIIWAARKVHLLSK